MRKSWFAVGLVAALASFGVALPSHAAPPLVASGSASCGEGTVSWSPAALWPPNHQFQPVTITYSESDGEGSAETLSISVGAIAESDAGKVGAGGPQHDPDWEFVSSSTGTDGGSGATWVENLRAERSGTDGNGSGRLYTIPVQCNDTLAGGAPEPGGGGMANVTVCVPHDMSAASRQFCVANVPGS